LQKFHLDQIVEQSLDDVVGQFEGVHELGGCLALLHVDELEQQRHQAGRRQPGAFHGFRRLGNIVVGLGDQFLGD